MARWPAAAAASLSKLCLECRRPAASVRRSHQYLFKQARSSAHQSNHSCEGNGQSHDTKHLSKVCSAASKQDGGISPLSRRCEVGLAVCLGCWRCKWQEMDSRLCQSFANINYKHSTAMRMVAQGLYVLSHVEGARQGHSGIPRNHSCAHIRERSLTFAVQCAMVRQATSAH